MENTNGTFWYRYETRRYSLGVNEYDQSLGSYTTVELRTLEVISTTPKGVWLRPWFGTWYGSDKHFVLHDARKRYACPTIEEAKESFIARKNRQIRILSAQLQEARKARDMIARGTEMINSPSHGTSLLPCP